MSVGLALFAGLEFGFREDELVILFARPRLAGTLAEHTSFESSSSLDGTSKKDGFLVWRCDWRVGWVLVIVGFFRAILELLLGDDDDVI